MKKYDVSHVKLTPELLNKAKEIKKYMEKVNNEIGITVNNEHYALDIWLRLTPDERYQVMKQIEQPKTRNIYQDRCIRAIAQYL